MRVNEHSEGVFNAVLPPRLTSAADFGFKETLK